VDWFETYIGKAWEAVPSPPRSYNCGELARRVIFERTGVDTNEIRSDARNLSERVKAFDPGAFGLRLLGEKESKREYDCVFMGKGRYDDHCGVAVETKDGFLVLHCLQSLGVVLETPREIVNHGFRRLTWYRLKALDV
jgi:hypothetical protein